MFLNYYLKKHTNLKHREVKYECEKCGENFGLMVKLKTHVETIHLGMPKQYFQCTQCDKQLSTKGILKRHNEFVHKKDVSYNCKNCDAKFFWESSLQRHMKSHDTS